ncbi:MAG: beta-galactosidase [Anaerolineae bacterium]|nr:beta-galactosidase [Anaerolineae bacterium]
MQQSPAYILLVLCAALLLGCSAETPQPQPTIVSPLPTKTAEATSTALPTPVAASTATPVAPTPAVTVAPARTAIPTATPVTRPQGEPWSPRPGFYVISNPDGANLAPSDYPVAGDLFYLPWELAEPKEGEYNWALLDRYLASRDAVGKRAAIALVTYGGKFDNGLRMPQWARVDGPVGSITATIVTGPNRAFPRYWSPAYRERYARFVQALGERYKSDPRMEYVGIGVGISGETKPVDNEDEATAAAYGLTSELWVSTVNDLVDLYAGAFAGGVVRPFLQYVPYYDSPRERWLWASHAAEKGIGLANLALFPDYNGAIGVWGQLEALRVYSDTVPGMFEAYQTTLPNPVEFEWGMLQALDKRASYIRLRRQFLADFDAQGRVTAEKREYTGIMRRWAPYFGATAATAPSIWVALRAHRDPVCYGTFGCESPPANYEPGNYTFYLTQVDAPGGQMVPVTNDARVKSLGDNAQPYDETLPPGPECWVCKRTDEATGNSKVFLRVDDRALGRFAAGALLRVRYLDRGRDAWRVYQSDSAVGSLVQKEDTGAWRTAELKLTSLATPDFYLSGEGDGDEWFHLIELLPLSVSESPAALTLDIDLAQWDVEIETGQGQLRLSLRPAGR